jgi:hypothetical protein
MNEINKFELKLETKLITKLKKIVAISDVPIPEEEIINLATVNIINKTNTLLITAKTEEAKRILSRFIRSKEDIIFKCDQFEYNNPLSGIEIKSNYSIKLLKQLIDFLNVGGIENITLKMKNNYPLLMENKHFWVILAPRI